MVPSGHHTPNGGPQPLPTSLLRSNSGFLGGQGGLMPSQGAFPSMMSSRNQLGNMHMLGSMSNGSALLPQSFANGGADPGISGLGGSQRGLMDNGSETDPLTATGNGIDFSAPKPSFLPSSMTANPNAQLPLQGQQFSNSSGNQISTDPQTYSQLDLQNYQYNQQRVQQFSRGSDSQQHQQQQQQQQCLSIRSGVGAGLPVKLEPQVTNDQTPLQGQALRNFGSVKQEPQQLQSMRGLAPVKLESQHSDSPLFSQQQQHQQQQQQSFIHVSRQSPQAAATATQHMHQQRLMQFQHQQQQQLMKANSQQRASQQQQFQTQNLHKSPVKPFYEPGMCARRLTHYMYQQQHRPEDNNIGFWKTFVAEYFAPNAKKKWCVSMYGTGRQTAGVFPQDVWHCEICNRKPGRGFEATVEVLPRLFKIKYESGTLEELLYVDMPREYQNSSGQIVLDYAKAIQESVFEQLRVVRDGQLRIVFSHDLKICSWEFCARRHEELIPRRLLISQVNQLGAAAQKYQATTQNAPSVPELQNNCNMFVASARQLAKTLEVPLVNDLGYTKRYVRCLQISEVVNSMKDLIDFSRETGTGPMESLLKFPRRAASSSGLRGLPQQSEDHVQQQQTMDLKPNGCLQTTSMQLPSSNGMANVNNMLNSVSPNSATASIAGLLHQNSMNSMQQNSVNGANSPYGGNAIQLPSPSSSGSHQQAQPNPSQFQSPTPSSSNNPQHMSLGGMSTGSHISSANAPNVSIQQSALPADVDASDSQSSVEKIIYEMMMTSQLGGGMMGVNNMRNDVKNINGFLPSTNNMSLGGYNGLNRNGVMNGNSGIGGPGVGSMSNGVGQAAMVNGIRAALSNNSAMSNGRVGMTMARETMNHQHDIGNQVLSGLGAVNGFNSLQFDWKSSP